MKKNSALAPRCPPAAAKPLNPRRPQVVDAYNEAADKAEENGWTADTE